MAIRAIAEGLEENPSPASEKKWNLPSDLAQPRM
jgi:hypothetical protein